MTAEGIARQLNSYEGDDWWVMLDKLASTDDVDAAATRNVNGEGALRSIVLTDHSRVEYDETAGSWIPTVDTSPR